MTSCAPPSPWAGQEQWVRGHPRPGVDGEPQWPTLGQRTPGRPVPHSPDCPIKTRQVATNKVRELPGCPCCHVGSHRSPLLFSQVIVFPSPATRSCPRPRAGSGRCASPSSTRPSHARRQRNASSRAEGPRGRSRRRAMAGAPVAGIIASPPTQADGCHNRQAPWPGSLPPLARFPLTFAPTTDLLAAERCTHAALPA